MAVFGILNGLAILTSAMPTKFESYWLNKGYYPPDIWHQWQKARWAIIYLSIGFNIVIMGLLYSIEIVKKACYWAMGNPQNEVYIWMSEIEGEFNEIVIWVMIICFIIGAFGMIKYRKLWQFILAKCFLSVLLPFCGIILIVLVFYYK